AEDGIRDRNVTGVQTCALPILESARIDVPILALSRKQKQDIVKMALDFGIDIPEPITIEDLKESGKNKVEEVIVDEAQELLQRKIGRASCRERVEIKVGVDRV